MPTIPEKPRIAEAKHSATVILIRGRAGAPWEVFLARRHERQSFMAGVYVFPGGQIDEADRRLSNRLWIPDGVNPRDLLQDKTLDADEACALFICAIRETFEETGILLAQTEGGHCPSSKQLEKDRTALCEGGKTFPDIVRQQSLFFSLNDLIPYAHWITPEIVPKRFSTRFFLAVLPPDQCASTDSIEMTDCLWTTPQEALAKYGNRTILLMPPTIKTLEELSAFPTLDALLAFARRKKIYPILPDPDGATLKLPHDPEYGNEKFRRPPDPCEPSRFRLIDGIWRTGFCPQK